MAVWQWGVWMVPRESILKRFERIPEYIDQDWFESVNWWAETDDEQIREFFDRILPRYYAPWAEYTEIWGDIDSDDVSLHVRDSIVADISIRVDLRHLNVEFLKALVNFARERSFVFVSYEFGRFISPSLRQMLDEINNSKKMLFIKNPSEFFKQSRYLEEINKKNREKTKSE
ncbi:MAG: hypothetical protein DYH05_08450 [Acidobacteria bacterium ACB1]|nr:hypothetical protein [Pyrinomonadaceae bacterium]MCE7962511.1 hypothetical protein [Acidobacteria bacterium ACB1]